MYFLYHSVKESTDYQNNVIIYIMWGKTLNSLKIYIYLFVCLTNCLSVCLYLAVSPCVGMGGVRACVCVPLHVCVLSAVCLCVAVCL